MASQEAAIKNNLNDRARKVGQLDQLTTQDIDALIAFYDYSCLQCGKKPSKSVDHVKPLMQGGTNTLDNLQLLCVEHNKAKGDEEIDYRGGKVFTPQTRLEIKDAYVNWKHIENRYITEEITLKDLAEQENVSESAIGQRAYRYSWSLSRQNYRQKVSSVVVQTLAEKEINARVIAGETAKAVISAWVGDPNQTARASDALEASKLLLTLAGQPTEIRELHIKLVAAILNTDELPETRGTQGGEPASGWLHSLASPSTDSPST